MKRVHHILFSSVIVAIQHCTTIVFVDRNTAWVIHHQHFLQGLLYDTLQYYTQNIEVKKKKLKTHYLRK